jgi:hypothetical protein
MFFAMGERVVGETEKRGTKWMKEDEGQEMNKNSRRGNKEDR